MGALKSTEQDHLRNLACGNRKCQNKIELWSAVVTEILVWTIEGDKNNRITVLYWSISIAFSVHVQFLQLSLIEHTYVTVDV